MEKGKFVPVKKVCWQKIEFKGQTLCGLVERRGKHKVCPTGGLKEGCPERRGGNG